jgi:hypothetical protein
MKKSQPQSRVNGRAFLTAICFGLAGCLASCNWSSKPATVVQDVYRAIERGEIDRAMTFMSQGFMSRQGIESVKQGLSEAAFTLKNDGGIKSLKVLKEDTVGDFAEVTVEVTRGNGTASAVHYKLVRENGAWKIDAITADSTATRSEPMHPETAMRDVVKWAHDAGATDLKSWFRRQPAPAICKAGEIDRSTLPDEIRYHDVDDAKARERLVTGLEPVIKLIACSNNEGVVLYKGLTIYAGNLQDGHVAITPGAAYFGSAPPEESIFHEIAKLRIVLAREIFRQMIAVEKPQSGSNDADMMLQRELKLNYLAAMVSLAVDKDPSIFDAAALDLATYANPPGIVSGTNGTPSLAQIQDAFGAAKQDFGDVSR